jgi:hypothetical protein
LIKQANELVEKRHQKAQNPSTTPTSAQYVPTTKVDEKLKKELEELEKDINLLRK